MPQTPYSLHAGSKLNNLAQAVSQLCDVIPGCDNSFLWLVTGTKLLWCCYGLMMVY